VLGGLCNPFSLFSLFTLIPYFFSFLFFPALRRVDFVGANCVRPPAIIGFGGGFWGFGFFWGIWGDLGARDAPLRVWGWFLGGLGFLGYLWGFGRTRCAPTGLGVVFGGFQKKYVGVNCDRL